MYEDKKKSKKVYVESKCVSRDDCCWDETPDNDIVESKTDQSEWPEHWTRQLLWHSGLRPLTLSISGKSSEIQRI